jgi:hypothetical protein
MAIFGKVFLMEFAIRLGRNGETGTIKFYKRGFFAGELLLLRLEADDGGFVNNG